jgi:phosphopantothenoylcysteine decarboxylase/phosphopantothenate--cysteine ligase
MVFKGKCVVLGVTGGIAAYKMANVASALRKKGAEVHVIMTKNATEFITPLTFETLTNNRCIVDTFDRNFQYDVAHISLAKKADVMLIAPATANVIAKIAHGLADDMLTTTVLAARCPKLVAPAMNTAMLENPATQDNLARLEGYGFTVIPSEVGMLACKDVGSGKLPREQVLLDYLEHTLQKKDLNGLRVTVTAGATREALDPVRYLTNHSTGKMGYALARAAAMRGAQVTLIHGKTALEDVPFVTHVPVVSAQDMCQAVQEAFPQSDVLIMSAAVADYKPAQVADNKMKKSDGELSIPLARTTDILGSLKNQKQPHQFICGFSMETENLVANSRAKLEKKGLDMVVANNLKTPGAGFGVDTNVVTFITADGTQDLPLMEKSQVAEAILDQILAMK